MSAIHLIYYSYSKQTENAGDINSLTVTEFSMKLTGTIGECVIQT